MIELDFEEKLYYLFIYDSYGEEIWSLRGIPETDLKAFISAYVRNGYQVLVDGYPEVPYEE